jgi:hypothetical protein|tara:strand:+ start:781 stop:1050 length:270 start_codon:yes stop_codon:yes gene_type:complete
MATIKDNRTGFPSLYRATYEEGWELKNTGYDYSKNLLNNTMSAYMFKNPRLKIFLEDYLTPIMVFYINKVKYVRIFYNFAVPKWYQKIN